MNKGIFALDPGGHSGIAFGIFDIYPSTSLEDSLKGVLHRGSETITGSEYDQIKLIAKFWTKFYRDCVFKGRLDPESIEFVCEDFVQRPGGSGGKEGQSPIRIMWGVEGYRMGRADEFKGRKVNSKAKIYAPRMILQMPSDAAALGTRERLKEWGCWVVGREHERAAWKHIALRIAVSRKAMLTASKL